jgi:hypothetical protein
MGGLFYTLSIGTGLTLAAWAIALTWDRLLHRRKTVTLAVIAGWIGIVALVNWNGPTLYPSLFCILVPLATGLTTLRLSAAGERHGLGQGWIPIAALALLTALWATQLDKQLFASIRDHVLLSNPVGRSVNDFYYRYTLYAAEAFKSFDQKTLRTARIRGTANPEVRKRVEGRLAQFDVIAVGSDRAPDIELDLSNESLRLERGGKTVVETILDPFLRNPAASLSCYAKATDRSGHFRKLTLIGLLGGFPIPAVHRCVCSAQGTPGPGGRAPKSGRRRFRPVPGRWCLALSAHAESPPRSPVERGACTGAVRYPVAPAGCSTPVYPCP